MKKNIIEDRFLVVQPIIRPTSNQVEIIKKSIGDDIFDSKEMKILKEKRSKSGLDKIILAHLFIQCIDNIKNNISKIASKDEEAIKARNNLKEYIKSVDDDYLRNLIEDFDNGKSYGSYYTGLKIKDIVGENKADMNIVISVFFAIFKDDD